MDLTEEAAVKEVKQIEGHLCFQTIFFEIDSQTEGPGSGLGKAGHDKQNT